MNIKTDHHIDAAGRHHVCIEGLRVWLYKSGTYWVAQGLDIDFTSAGDTQQQAAESFIKGLCMTIVEHVKRFKSLEKLVSRRAPDEIYHAWIRELEGQNLTARSVEFEVPASELRGIPPLSTLPHRLNFFHPTHAH